MRNPQPMSLLVLVAGFLLGCDSPKSSLGELPAEATDSATTAMPPTGDYEPAPGGVGAPCELDGVPESRLLELDNPDCASSLCLYADTITADPQQTCTDSTQCTGFGEGVYCNTAEGRCELNPNHVIARSMCTEECTEDADCVGEDGTACQGGFACAPVAALGSLCCQKLCVCRDDLDVAAAELLALECAEGTAPGCCDQDPPGPGCGG